MAAEDRRSTLAQLSDDKLGTIAVALTISELHWTPDVAPAVLDRVSRDAVAYPEQFDRRPVPSSGNMPGFAPTRSPGRSLARIAIFGVILAIVAALVFVAATANAVGAADGGDEAATAEPSMDAEPSAAPTFDPASVQLRIEQVLDGMQTPVYFADDGTGRACFYIVERGGVIRTAIREGIRTKPFLDISELVSEGVEQGLHSVAFHPGFAKNGRFFVHYNDTKGRTRIDEFKGKPCRTAEPEAVKRILVVDQPRINNNGGWIGFGPDGYLYVPLGDGGGRSPGDPDGLGQDKATLLSKVLRIDVDSGRRYAIPKSNPFAKRPKGFAKETWAWGLRDPRRSSFDRLTGDLWIGDVGEDRAEEIDRIPAGVAPLNFGWSDMEGDSCHNLPDCDPSAYEPPTHFYDSVSPHCGVIGGYVYRGEAIPELYGVYLFSDFCSGYIWGIDADAVAAGGPAVAHVLLDAPQQFVSFGEDDDGELYLVALDGILYHIEAEEPG